MNNANVHKANFSFINLYLIYIINSSIKGAESAQNKNIRVPFIPCSSELIALCTRAGYTESPTLTAEYFPKISDAIENIPAEAQTVLSSFLSTI